MPALNANWPKTLFVLAAQLLTWVLLQNGLVSSSLAEQSALLKSSYQQGSVGSIWNRKLWLKWRTCARGTGLWSRSWTLTKMLISCRPSCLEFTGNSVHKAIFLLSRKAKPSVSGRQIVLGLRFSKKATSHKLATHTTTSRVQLLTKLTDCGPVLAETGNHPVSCQLA